MATHPFNKSKFNFEILRWKNRINALPKSILLLFLVTFISIVVIEFWLINIPALVNFFAIMGVVYLKICYSFFSAFIFYFLVVHIPKEKRKLKAFRLISNKVHTINSHVFNLINALFFRKLDRKDIYEVKAENIIEACKKNNPNSAIQVTNYDSASYEKITYNNWFDFFASTASSIKSIIKDILILNESVDAGLLEALTNLDDSIRWLTYENKFEKNDLEFASRRLIEVKNDSYTLFKSFHKAYGKFTVEYHTAVIKKNRQLIKQGTL